MKKLLIAMTAAAVGVGAWAEDTVTYLNETFSAEWTTTDNEFWSYTGDAATELTITNVAAEAQEADYALSLNTGSKVLTGSFASNKNAVPMTDRPFFSASVKFQDPSDTLPELANGDKFALVVLDNVECVDAEMIGEDKRATNLWVIAGHSTGKRAYLLSPVKDGSQNLDEVWLGRTHEIIVKAYSSVMADKEHDNAGFLVMVDGNVCPVLASYAITNKMIDYDNYEGGNYLGFTAEQIDSSLVKRYTKDKTLLLSAAYSTDLTSVDFQGQGVIDNVALAESTEADFGSDATVVTFDGYDADAIASITYGGQTVTGGAYTITGNENVTEDTVEIVVTLNSGYAIKVGDGAIENTYAFTKTLASAAETISLDVFEIQVRVNGTAYGSFAEALAAADGSAIVLARDVTIAENDTYGLEINSGDVVIDLNGKTIQAGANEEENAYASTFTVYGGTLLIKDSSEAKSGKVLISAAAMENDSFAIDATGGRTTIEAGQIGLIGNYSDDTLKLVGGTYTDVGDTFIYWGVDEKQYDDSDKTYKATVADGIWTVAEKPAAPSTFVVTYTAENATITKDDVEFLSGTELANDTYTFKVAAAEGYDIVSVTVGGEPVVVAEGGTFSVTVNGADVAIVVEASLKTFDVALGLTGATVDGVEEKKYDYGSTVSFTVVAAEGYEAPFTVKAGETVLKPTDGTYTFTVNADVTITVVATKKALQPLPGNATDADVSAALGTQADTAVTENIKTVADYTEFQKWAAVAGTDKVAGSQNAYAAYVLDAAGLLDATDKLVDADIKVKAFAQDTAAGADVGTFALEIKIKDCEIGPNANSDKLGDLIVAEGWSELDLTKFSTDNVTKTVVIEGNKAKFKVKAKETKDTYFFMMKFNKK